MNILKSKTVNFNIVAGAVITILSSVGITIPVEVVTAVLCLGNFILRLVTKKPISEK